MGLVYGISVPAVQKQFSTYLRGLAAHADIAAPGGAKPSFAVFTPSRFSADRIPPDLAGRVVYLNLSHGDLLPAHAQPGTVYVVETPTLPRTVFVGLMARSEIPPIVSGDNALSAALTLGKPFVMTKIDHNRRTVASVGKVLLEHANPDQKDVLSTLFGLTASGTGTHDLSRALELTSPEMDRVFARVGPTLQPLSDRLIAAATRAVSPATYETALSTPDRGLRLSLLIKASSADPRAARVVRDYLERNPERALGLVVTGVLDARALGDPGVRQALARVLEHHSSKWAQEFGRHLEKEPTQAVAELSTEEVRLKFADLASH
jgi:hypothetical protein